MTGIRWQSSAASSSTSSSLSIQTPIAGRRSRRLSACSSQSLSGTRQRSPTWPSSASLGSTLQSSSTICWSLISSGLDSLLERLHAKAVVGVEKRLFCHTFLHVQLNDLGDHIDHFVAAEGRPQNRRERGAVARVAPQLDLVELLTFFVHAQNADITDVVMAAGVHAPRDIE